MITLNYFTRPQPRDLNFFYLMMMVKQKIVVRDPLLWVHGMAWMSVRFPGLKFCPSLASVS